MVCIQERGNKKSFLNSFRIECSSVASMSIFITLHEVKSVWSSLKGLKMFIDEVAYKVVRESDDLTLDVVGFATAKVEAYMLAINSSRLVDTVRVYSDDGDSLAHVVDRDGYDIIAA